MSSSAQRQTGRPRPTRSSRTGAGPGEGASSDARGADIAAILRALRRIVRALRLNAARAEEETGLTAAQLFVLAQVAETPGLSLSAAAARTLTDRTSVAAVVDRLAAKGLLRAERSANDRRRVEIRASEAGRATLARAPHAPTQLVLDGVAALSDRDLRSLATGLARLAEAMGLADAPATMLFEEPLGRPAKRGRQAARGKGSGSLSPHV